MRASITIRYCGDEEFSRRFLLQRKDGKFYTGRAWTALLAEARLYDKLSTAQSAYRAVMNRTHRGQPERKFKVQLDLSVRGSGNFSLDDLRRYLAQALHLNFDNAAAGDGPDDTFVRAVAVLSSLQEVEPVAGSRSNAEMG